MEIANLLSQFSWPEGMLDHAQQLHKSLRLRLNSSDRITRMELEPLVNQYSDRDDLPGLFGTSGIRGTFSENLTGHAAGAFVNLNEINVKLAYFFGRAAAQILAESNPIPPVSIIMDPRRSSLGLTMALLSGFQDEGVAAAFGGIAPTPCYTLNSSGMTIVVTASHNPVDYNGLKIFLAGRPLVKSLERRIESIIRALSDLDQKNQCLEPNPFPGHLSDAILNTTQQHFKSLINLVETISLRLEEGMKLETVFLPLDLAYGSAACPVDANGFITEISPAIALFLSLEIPIIGYGCMRNPDMLNHRIGAAYAYCETPDTPRPDELAKFAQGLPGYGSETSRIAFIPEQFSTSDKELCDWLTTVSGTDAVYTIPIKYPEFRSNVLIVLLDNPAVDARLATAIDTEMMKRRPLPGLMVDGDADRILVTSPELSKKETPYLTGDAMIRLFAEITVNGQYDDIVFTVESGMAVEKALINLQKHRLLAEQKPFQLRAVTVGDRAIIDFFLEHNVGSMMGGEPSGHIIFGNRENDRQYIIDDPFVTYIRLLSGLAYERFNLDRVLDRMFRDIPEVYCARKPDSKAGSGITLKEKRRLELWDVDRPEYFSPYAKEFIPAYIMLFSYAYGKAFLNSVKPDIAFTDTWRACLEKPVSIQNDFQPRIADIQYHLDSDQEKIFATLHIDDRDWAGPEVIRLNFFLVLPDSGSVKIGEGVFRNSGTSPKNAGYNKLWPKHPTRKITLSEGTLREILDELASQRAKWTDGYVRTVLRA